MKKFKNKKETEFDGNNNFSGEKKESGVDEEILPSEKYKAKNRKIIFLFGAVALLFIIVVGIYLFYKQPPDPPETKPSSQTEEKSALSDSLQEKLSKQSKLQKFSSYEDIKNYLSSLSEIQTGGLFSMPQMTDLKNVEDSGFSAAQREAAAPEGLGEGADYSETNIQVEGVDEADIIKTDGRYVYAVSQKDLYIAEAFPAQEAKVLSKIEFENLPQDIYINDDKLVIFGNDTQVFIQDEATAKEAMPNNLRADSSYVFFKIFDISDKKNPSQIRDLKFEGNYFNSRMIGNQVYFLTSKYARYYDANFLLPKILENGEEIYSLNGGRCLDCPPVYYAEIPYNNYSFINVAAVNLSETDKKPENQIYLLPSTQNMYVSQNNIYITYTKHLNQSEIMLEVMFDVMYPKLSPEDKERADKIMSADKDLLTQQEKAEKITRIFEKYGLGLSEERASNLQKEIQDEIAKKMDWISKEIEKTVVHKINIANGKLNYKGSGEVTGTVLNQFSMDEKDDYFRIATTRNQQWLGMWGIRGEEKQQESFNNLYVLDENLKIAGSLEGLAQDEKIYSVRFMQDRAYMVTFKQIDPLFVIDLKNPKNPKVLGKLKIPGFSNYLHPYSDNLLIGLGKETEENEHGGVITKGLKLSLFDVSNVSQPKEVDKYIFQDKNTTSIAQNEHKAFLFSQEKNLLAFPISVNQPVFINNVRQDMEIVPPPVSNYFRGAAVFRVDENGFELKGLIDHSEGEGIFQENNYGRRYYSNTIQRILYIENVLYTFSNNYLQLNALNDLSQIKKLDLQNSLGEDHRVIN